MAGSYNYWLVLLSIVVAVLAFFVALDLASRLATSAPGRKRLYWLAGGALSMGTGIWSTDFIGMLAFRLPIPVSYDIPMTLLSLLVAIMASLVALIVTSRDALGTKRLLVAGVLVGTAIISMHYLGMEAMRMEPPIRYRPFPFALSIAIAVGAAMIALWSAFRLRLETMLSAFWKRAGSALIMGGAMFGMHYTAMAAASFAPESVCTVSPQSIQPVGLAVALGASTLLFLVGTLLVSSYDAYRAVLLQNQASRASEEVARLSGRLVAMHDEERRELAAELHDIVGQDLAAANTALAWLASRLPPGVPPEVPRRLEEALALVKRSVAGLRSVMVQLHPPGLEELGLAGVLRWHADAFESRTGIAVTLAADEKLPRASPAAANALLRIFLETLHNVAKHAGASRVHVRLEARGDRVVLSIADDGRGFDTARPVRRDEKSGWGLMIMQERARAIGAELHIDSAPGAGTRVEILVPRDRWS
jgi:NO-binding membrane sensor protein with MHYT domain/two-component sensor histidine kinase